ncbi:hypothetical protein [Bacillus sp. 03113]|uniref:hypothetical protein n=1 Tax=Bacillus sp. 03113 TaxID=2578211 RepID=UPI0011449670|nr:hypothetical protein [Bacillus sp. 03113]
MKRLKFFLLIIIPILLFCFFYFRFDQEFGDPAHDEIQVGFNVDDESVKVNDPAEIIKANQAFNVVVTYANMVEGNSNFPAKLQITSLESNEIIFEDNWIDSYGISGKTNKIYPENWKIGKYNLTLFRNDKVITTKTIELK